MTNMRGSQLRMASIAIAASFAAALPAVAADRCVLIEDFNATWCGPCVNSGQGISQLMDQFPGQIALMQIHLSDGEYTLPWGSARANAYGITGIPNVWFDGVINRIGSTGDVPSNYNQYLNAFNTRDAVTTNYTISMGAEQLASPVRTYRVTARVGLEADVANPKTARVYIVRVRDHYPAGAHYRNCLMQMATPEYQDVTIQPGHFKYVVRDFTAPGADWNDRVNMRFIAWAQQTTGKTAFQSHIISYPFSAIFPDGDMNCDGSVNQFDINGFVVALNSVSQYGQSYPDCRVENADMNDDGSVNQFDIQGFVNALGG